MTLTDGSRKRQRSCDDEGCEFMPISKKINNLRIQASSSDTVDEDTSSSAGSCADRAPPSLGPVVVANGIENSHYGVINRLLYEAHLQRQQRMLSTSRHISEHCPGPSQL
uniref:Uncharacterized protein n=1 Tax=Amblyomma maculatum TaxID=34609 RepID=G3MLN9_AMBMU